MLLQIKIRKLVFSTPLNFAMEHLQYMNCSDGDALVLNPGH